MTQAEMDVLMAEHGTLWAVVNRYESELIAAALEKHEGQVTGAARTLGISHQALGTILNGRQEKLLVLRTEVKRRRKSIVKIRSRMKFFRPAATGQGQ